MPGTTQKIVSPSNIARLACILSVAIVALCIFATILAESERLWWRAYLVAQFRVEIFALSALTAVGLAAFRGSTHLAICASLCALINYSHLLPYYVWHSQSLMASDKTMKLMQINLNVKNKQYEAVTSYVKKNNPDVVLFEELTPEWKNYFEANLKTHPFAITETRLDTYGIGMYCKTAPKYSRIAYLGKSGHPSIIAELQGLEKPVCILHTHVQGPVKKEFFRWHEGQFLSMENEVKQLPRPLVVSGDMNSNAWTYLLCDFIRNSGLVDTQQGRGIRMTWPTPFYWRYGLFPLLAIDHFFVSDDIIVKKRELGIPNSSDHYPVIIEFSL